MPDIFDFDQQLIAALEKNDTVLIQELFEDQLTHLKTIQDYSKLKNEVNNLIFFNQEDFKNTIVPPIVKNDSVALLKDFLFFGEQLLALMAEIIEKEGLDKTEGKTLEALEEGLESNRSNFFRLALGQEKEGVLKKILVESEDSIDGYALADYLMDSQKNEFRYGLQYTINLLNFAAKEGHLPDDARDAFALFKYERMKKRYHELKKERSEDPSLKKDDFFQRQYKNIKKQLYASEKHKKETLDAFTIENKNLMAGFPAARAGFKENPFLAKFSKHSSKMPYSYINCRLAPELTKEMKAKLGSDSEGLVLALINGNILGEGAFARVKLAMNEKGEFFAVRIVSMTVKQTGDEKRAGIKTGLLVGEAIGSEVRYEVMRRVEGEELQTLIKTKHYIEESAPEERLMLAISTLMDLDKIHSNDIRHDDLKPGNIVGKADIKTGIVEATIIDMGGARVSPVQEGNNELKRVVYTPGYEAPELRSGNTLKSDIYSQGITVKEILGFGPKIGQFEDDNPFDPSFKKQFDVNTLKGLKTQINNMTDINPDERPSARQAADNFVGVLRAMPIVESNQKFVANFMEKYEDKRLAETLLGTITNNNGGIGQEEKLRRLIKANPSLNINVRDARNNTALMNAVEHNHIPVIKLLLDAGANPDAGKWTPQMQENWKNYLDAPHAAQPSPKAMIFTKRPVNVLQKPPSSALNVSGHSALSSIQKTEIILPQKPDNSDINKENINKENINGKRAGGRVEALKRKFDSPDSGPKKGPKSGR